MRPASAGQAGLAGGAAPWARCFTMEAGPDTVPAGPPEYRPWRIRFAAGYPFRPEVGLVFGEDPAAGRLLAVIGDPGAAGAPQAALAAAQQAAQDGTAAGRLVVITTGKGLTGLFASLHAEQPALGITVLHVPATADGPRLARPYARAEPGQFRELVIAPDGTAREPALAECAVTGGAEFPLGPADVTLVSRSSGTAALALAQVLACCGAAVAVIGQPAPDEGGGVDRGPGGAAAGRGARGLRGGGPGGPGRPGPRGPAGRAAAGTGDGDRARDRRRSRPCRSPGSRRTPSMRGWPRSTARCATCWTR